MRLNATKTFTLGLGFFSVSLVWAIYNSFMPIFYSQFVQSTALVGLFMTFDNIAALTLQPVFGSMSDRTWTRFGRRMPYVLIGMPLAAIFFAVIPFGAARGLAPLLGTAIIMNIFMAAFRSPVIALMPDVTPSPLRSQANGIINFMGGLGGILAYFVGSMLYERAHYLPFIAISVLMLIIPGALLLTVKEPRVAAGKAEEEFSLVGAAREVLHAEDKSALFLLLAIMFWFIGYGGVEALFTKYGVRTLGLEAGKAAFAVGFIPLFFVVFALPAGYLAARFGRKRTILTGIVILTALFVVLAPVRSVITVEALFAVAGMGWALINVNSYPMVADLAGADNTGAYTSLYYVFSSVAAIVGPPLFGFLMDRYGYGTMFYWSAIFFVIAFVFMSQVRRGEARRETAATKAA